MTKTNCMALSKVESLLALQLKNIENPDTKRTVQRKTHFRIEESILGKLKNPETKEFFYTKCLLRPISKLGQISDITSLSLITFFLYASICSHAEGSIEDVKKLEQAIGAVYDYLKVSGIATLPFILADAIQQECEVTHIWKKDDEKKETQKEPLDEETLKRTIRLVKALKQEDPNFEYNFARSFLNNTEISENNPEYNKKLLILLSNIIENESAENLESLAMHLDSENLTTKKNTSKEFTNNRVVKQLVKSYLPTRS